MHARTTTPCNTLRVLVLVLPDAQAADALRLHASLTRAEALKSAIAAVTLTLSPLAAGLSAMKMMMI